MAIELITSSLSSPSDNFQIGKYYQSTDFRDCSYNIPSSYKESHIFQRSHKKTPGNRFPGVFL